MPASRDAVRLSEQETADFLGAQRKVQVATVGPGGAPHQTTLFYVLDQGRIAFWTYRRSQKIANLRRDPRLSCLVEDGEDYAELRGVSINGTARLVEDYDQVKRIGALVLARMADGADLGELGDQIVSAQARKRVAVIVEADRIASWDHRKMQALPGSGT